MIKELQLTVAPQVANTVQNLQTYIATTEGIAENTINGVLVLKKPLDARKRTYARASKPLCNLY
jgi:hypothetical protein